MGRPVMDRGGPGGGGIGLPETLTGRGATVLRSPLGAAGAAAGDVAAGEEEAAAGAAPAGAAAAGAAVAGPCCAAAGAGPVCGRDPVGKGWAPDRGPLGMVPGAVVGLACPGPGAALGAPGGGEPGGRGADVRGESMTSLADLLTTRRCPGRGSWVTGAVWAAAGLEPASSPGLGLTGAGSGVTGAVFGRSAAGALAGRCDPPARGAEAMAGDGAGSSGWTARRNPSRSAFRRARSACASSIDDEWLLTPIPRSMQMSRASLLVSPSSRASS